MLGQAGHEDVRAVSMVFSDARPDDRLTVIVARYGSVGPRATSMDCAVGRVWRLGERERRAARSAAWRVDSAASIQLQN